jgi:hypothetical protein
MQPPKTALGTLAVGLGVISAGTIAGGYIGSRMLPVGKHYGAMQGGTLGALLTAMGSVLVSTADPDWAPALGISAFAGLAVFTVAAVASVATVNKTFEQLGPNATITAAAIDAAASGQSLTLPTTIVATTATPSIITLSEGNTGQTIAAHVGDTIILSLQLADTTTGWFYAEGATASVLSYSGRVVNAATANVPNSGNDTDTWSVIGVGTTTLTVQLLGIDSSGNPVAGTPQQTLTFTIEVT